MVHTLTSVKKLGELLDILLKGSFWNALNTLKARKSEKAVINYTHRRNPLTMKQFAMFSFGPSFILVTFFGSEAMALF